MSKPHTQIIEAQFGPRAKAYVESAVHAGGPDLKAFEAVVEQIKPARALDLGAGGGHVSYILAARSGHVVAADLSSDMLAAIRATAEARSLDNIETVQTAAERLPFEPASFDFVASRYSAHHWQDFHAGLREARRVLKPGGRAVFIDVHGAGSPLFDTHLQAVELLRDTSHVRDYTSAEWLAALGHAGFGVTATRSWRIRMEFASWIARMQTPALYAQTIRDLQTGAPEEVKRYFEIEADGSFLLDVAMVEANAI